MAVSDHQPLAGANLSSGMQLTCMVAKNTWFPSGKLLKNKSYVCNQSIFLFLGAGKFALRKMQKWAENTSVGQLPRRTNA